MELTCLILFAGMIPRVQLYSRCLIGVQCFIDWLSFIPLPTPLLMASYNDIIPKAPHLPTLIEVLKYSVVYFTNTAASLLFGYL